MAEEREQPPEESREPKTGDKLCEACHEEDARYRCPRCKIRTCSLQCSKAHKESTGCTGKRSRTGFVPLTEFDERVLLSDYRFLEEAAAAGDAAQRVAPGERRAVPPQHARELVHQARIRGVALHLQHPGMERRAHNTSMYRRMRGLCWHVEWRFPAADFTAVDKRVAEGRPVGEVLAAHLALAPGGAEKAHRLRAYAEAGVEALTVVMRQELRPANDPASYRIPGSLSLAGALRGKTVVEHPVFTVLLPHELPAHKLIEPEQAAAAVIAAAAAARGLPPPQPPSCPPPAPPAAVIPGVAHAAANPAEVAVPSSTAAHPAVADPSEIALAEQPVEAASVAADAAAAAPCRVSPPRTSCCPLSADSAAAQAAAADSAAAKSVQIK